MNRKQANEWRVAHGMPPLPEVDHTPQRKRQNANRAARAAESQRIRSLRARPSK